MRTMIYFLRHAEAQSNANPLFQGEVNALTEKGKAQALAVANRCKTIPLEQIYTSTVLRARLTGDEIAKETRTELIELDFLKERKTSYSSPTEYQYLESFGSLIGRLDTAKTFFENLTSKHVAVVSHAIFLKSFFAYLLLKTPVDEETFLRVADMFILDHTALSVLEYNHEKNRWRIYSLNDQCHIKQ